MYIHDWPLFLLRKGLFLAGLLLCAAVITAVWVSASPEPLLETRRYVGRFASDAALTLGSCLFAALILEDAIRKSNG
ncbi:MAG: hypothetical protein LUD69_01385 [Oscillospiraceae bacterium]|nr:hypothetical protein [Oscillospiraceae bacterium]MCD8375578.1 hypothetical protein [Oscillospiraceae bacterium]